MGGGDIFKFLKDGRAIQRGRYDIIPFAGGSIGSIVSPQSFAGLSSSSSVWGRNDDEAKRNLTVRGIRGWISDT